MKNNAKDIIKISSIVAIYILLGMLGVYSAAMIFLLPILALPMTIYLMSSSVDIKRDVLINLGISVGVYLLSGNLVEVMFYGLNVILPAYIVAMLYRKKASTPHIVMYTSTAVIGVLFICIIVLKYWNIDYIQSYIHILETYKSIQFELFDSISGYGINSEQIDLLKQVIASQIEVLKIVYPAVFFIITVWMIVIEISLVTIISKLRKWRISSLRGLFNFKLSKASILVFLLSFVLIQGTSMENSSWTTLGWNMFFFMNSLYQIIGIISMFVLLKRSRFGMAMKVIGGILMFVLIYSSPSMVMMFGILDTIFNYRKVSNIV